MATLTLSIDPSSPSEMTAQIDQSKGLRLLFDDTTSERAVYETDIPDNDGGWSSVDSGYLLVYYTMASAVADKQYFQASVMAVSDGDAQDLDADSYDTANAANETVPGTAGNLSILSIALTNLDSMAPLDYVRLKLEDVRAGQGDKATGDCEVRQLTLVLTVS